MTLTIELPDHVQQRLSERALRDGKSVELVVSELIQKEVAPDMGRTYAEIMAPFSQEFAESGMTEAELDDLIKQARSESWELRHGTQP